MTFLLLSVDGVNSTQLALIHEAVKELATSWWHQQSGVWLVETDVRGPALRDRVGQFTKGVGGTVLVLALPPDAGDRRWASKGFKTEWLKERYAPSFTYNGKPGEAGKNRAVER